MRRIMTSILIIFLLTFSVWNISRPVVDNYIEKFEWTETYRVRKGDTLWQLAEEINSDKEDPRIIIAAIKKVNDIDSLLKIDQKIIIPCN